MMALSTTERLPQRRRPPGSLCLLCSAVLARASARGTLVRGVCGGCAERLELELTAFDGAACPNCGRHIELCAVMPCNALPAERSERSEPRSSPPPVAVPLVVLPPRDDRTFDPLHRRQLSGAERVRAIERLAATRLGVRELARRTGFAPSTISRWLKIDRCPPLKKAVETEALDIGRAKLLADAPASALRELIPLAAGVSRVDLASHVATLRRQTGCARSTELAASGGSRRLRKAVTLVEAITRVDAGDRPTLERLRSLVDGLLQASAQ